MRDGPLEDVEMLKRKKAVDSLSKKEAAEDLRAVMSTKEGRRFAWRLISFEGLSYTGKAFSTAFNEGKREFRLQLRADLQRDAPREYLEMMRESIERVQVQFPAPPRAETEE